MIDALLMTLVTLTYFLLWRVAVLFYRGEFFKVPQTVSVTPAPLATVPAATRTLN